MKRLLLAGGMLVMVLGLLAATASAEPTYVGADKCKMCHKIQHTSWLETKHAKATEVAKASTKPAWTADCLTCHATAKNEAMAGVQCEACHGAGSDYKSIQVMKDRAKAQAAGMVIPTQATCNGCHDGKDHHKAVTFTRDVHAHKS